MNVKSFYVILVVLSIFISACSDSSSDFVTIEFDDPKAATTTSGNTVDFSDESIPSTGHSGVPYGIKPPDTTKILADKSEVVTMYDGYGNIIETRTFSGHPKLSSITVNTTIDGKREIIVYGFNGERKVLPDGMYERAMSDNADAIAHFVGIVSVRQVLTRRVAKTSGASTPIPVSPPSKVETNDSLPEKAGDEARVKVEQENSQLLQN